MPEDNQLDEPKLDVIFASETTPEAEAVTTPSLGRLWVSYVYPSLHIYQLDPTYP